jgi:hypothetical protein
LPFASALTAQGGKRPPGIRSSRGHAYGRCQVLVSPPARRLSGMVRLRASWPTASTRSLGTRSDHEPRRAWACQRDLRWKFIRPHCSTKTKRRDRPTLGLGSAELRRWRRQRPGFAARCAEVSPASSLHSPAPGRLFYAHRPQPYAEGVSLINAGAPGRPDNGVRYGIKSQRIRTRARRRSGGRSGGGGPPAWSTTGRGPRLPRQPRVRRTGRSRRDSTPYSGLRKARRRPRRAGHW